MSYSVRDETNIEYWRVAFTLSTGKKTEIRKSWVAKDKDLAQKEADRLPEGEIVPVYGWKEVKTEYPTCPKCGRQGASSGLREYNYNGGGEYFHCLNPECKHEWCWS